MARMLLLTLLVAAAPARAHPLSGALPAHALRLTVGPAELLLDYRLRLPLHDARDGLRAHGARGVEDPAAAVWVQEELDALAAGVLLRIDDEPARWTRRAAGGPAGDRRYVHLDQVLAAPLPAGAQRVALSLGNLPDQPSFFRSELQVVAPLRLSACSLLDLEGGRVRRNREARWVAEESARELWLELAPAEPRPLRLLRRLGGEPSGARPAEQALALGPVHTLRGGALPPAGVGAALVGAALAGRRGPPGSADVAALALLGLLAWGSTPALAGLCAALYTLGRGLLPPSPARTPFGWACWALAAALAVLATRGA